MSTAEINKTKSDLIAWINQINDEAVLSFLDGLRKGNKDVDWWAELRPEQRHEIEAGLKDSENGKLISSEDFWKNLNNARQKKTQS